MKEYIIDFSENPAKYLEAMQSIAEEYGCKVDIQNTRDGFYLGACLKEHELRNDLFDTYTRMASSPYVFSVKDFAVKIDNKAPHTVADLLIEYCEKVEMLKVLCNEFDCPLEDKWSKEDVEKIKKVNEDRFDHELPEEAREEMHEGLKALSNRANLSSLRKKWKEFVLSDKHNNNVGFLRNLINFFNRDSNIVEKEVLLNNKMDIKRNVIGAEFYDEFKKIMSEKYPEVVFSIDKPIVTEGVEINAPDEQNPWANRNIGSHTYIPLYYADVDEWKIAGAYYSVLFKDFPDNSVDELYSRGEVVVFDIDIGDVWSITGMLKQSEIPFHLDRGDNGVPSFSKYQLAVNCADLEEIKRLINMNIYMKSKTFHPLTSLTERVQIIDDIKIVRDKGFVAAQVIDKNNDIER